MAVREIAHDVAIGHIARKLAIGAHYGQAAQMMLHHEGHGIANRLGRLHHVGVGGHDAGQGQSALRGRSNVGLGCSTSGNALTGVHHSDHHGNQANGRSNPHCQGEALGRRHVLGSSRGKSPILTCGHKTREKSGANASRHLHEGGHNAHAEGVHLRCQRAQTRRLGRGQRHAHANEDQQGATDDSDNFHKRSRGTENGKAHGNEDEAQRKQGPLAVLV